MTTFTAVIPTIPARTESLTEALESVSAQTYRADQTVVLLDTDREGPAVIRNRCAEHATGDWLAFLDDDDVWYPNHLANIVEHTPGADVVYTDCTIVGGHRDLAVNRDFDPFTLELQNYIPVTAAVRRAAFEAVDGFNPDAKEEDWDLWRRLAAAGATFVHVPVVTWEYRFHGDQRTFGR